MDFTETQAVRPRDTTGLSRIFWDGKIWGIWDLYNIGNIYIYTMGNIHIYILEYRIYKIWNYYREIYIYIYILEYYGILGLKGNIKHARFSVIYQGQGLGIVGFITRLTMVHGRCIYIFNGIHHPSTNPIIIFPA